MRRSDFHWVTWAGIMAMWVLAWLFVEPAWASDSTPPSRSPVPAQADWNVALAQVREVYAERFNAKDERTRRSVMQELLHLGKAVNDSKPAERYALLMASCEAAESLADVPGIDAAMTALDQQFEVNSLQMRLDIGKRLASKNFAKPAELAVFVLGVVHGAIDAQNMPMANIAHGLAVSLLAKVNDRETAEDLRTRISEARIGITEAGELATHRARLKEKPDDSVANHMVGWYLATRREDWNAALPHLAKSNEDAVRKLALADLSKPATPDEQFDVGESWWKFAEAQKTRAAGDAFRRRAADWFALAQPGIKGLRAKTIESRLMSLPRVADVSVASARPLATTVDLRGLKFEWFNGGNFEQKMGERIDYKISANFGGGTAGTGGWPDSFSARWSGFLRPPTAGRYVFRSSADDGFRLKINGKTVLESWSLIQDLTATVDLTDEPVEIVYEMNERRWGAACWLRWYPPGEKDAVIVPPTVFFQTREAALNNKTARIPGTGLTMTAYGDKELKHVVGTDIDDNIEWLLGDGPLAQGMKSDHFSVRWEGFFIVPKAGNYVFWLWANDGVRLWIDGRRVVDAWRGGDQNANFTLDLDERPHEIVCEYFEIDGNAGITLHWAQVGGFGEQIMPPSAFFQNRAAAQREIERRR